MLPPQHHFWRGEFLGKRTFPFVIIMVAITFFPSSLLYHSHHVHKWNHNIWMAPRLYNNLHMAQFMWKNIKRMLRYFTAMVLTVAELAHGTSTTLMDSTRPPLPMEPQYLDGSEII